ncbi:MAG: ABC transporter ATP-binding protein [Thermodesulfobium sp.]
MIGKIIDGMMQLAGNRAEAWHFLGQPILLTLSAWIGLDLSFRLGGLLFAKLIPKIESDARMTLYDQVLDHSHQYFVENMAGNIANKVATLPDSLRYILSSLMGSIIPASITLLIAMYVFFLINPLFAGLIAGWVVLHLTLSIYLFKKCATYSLKHAQSRSYLLGHIIDSVVNYFAVKTFASKLYEQQTVKQFQQDELVKNENQRVYIEKVKLGLAILTWMIPGIALNSLAYLYWAQGLISVGEFSTLFYTALNITLTVWLVGINLPDLFREIGASQNSLSLIQTPPEVVNLPNAKDIRVYEGEIEFKKVHFRYPNVEPLFSDKSVKIKAGEKVGLVGYSGSGKTTFINLILKLFNIQSGEILIDGQDISHVSQESLRQAISIVPQDPFLFHRTIRENIRYGCITATDEEVIEASKKAYAHEFIESLPQRYDSLVGERGIKLSAGQRQRIAIARAFLKDAPILVLDEATSSLDSITEKSIQASLSELTKNRTTVLIAHRLSTLLHVDRILVFNKGKIVEEGTHSDLIAMNGLYKKLWENQSDGFLGDRAERLCA